MTISKYLAPSKDEKMKLMEAHKKEIEARVNVLKENSDAVFMAKSLQIIDDYIYHLGQIRDFARSILTDGHGPMSEAEQTILTLALDTITNRLMNVIIGNEKALHTDEYKSTCLDVVWTLVRHSDKSGSVDEVDKKAVL